MPRPRLPVAKAKAKGADVKDPQRHRGRKAPKSQDLGAPSVWMTEPQQAVWEAFKKELPWLCEADRTLMEIACTIRCRVVAGEEVGVQALNLLRQCLNSMGATPADRSKVSVADDGDGEDPAEEYFQH